MCRWVQVLVAFLQKKKMEGMLHVCRVCYNIACRLTARRVRNRAGFSTPLPLTSKQAQPHSSASHCSMCKVIYFNFVS